MLEAFSFMLSRIFIQNFALIDSLEISLHKGLQVITGETGAGKSIILGALRLILGERADLKSIGDAETKSVVEAEFSVSKNLKPFFDDNDLDFDTQTIIRREILPSGKSRAFVNDVPVTLGVLKELSEQLIDIHSQFETSNLFNEEYQFKIIDGFGENKILAGEFLAEFNQFKKLQKELNLSETQLAEGYKESDYKAFLLNELEAVDLENLNLEELQEQLSTQENAEAISENLAEVFARINQEGVGILDAFADVRNKLSKISLLSSQFSELNERFESNFLELKDVVDDLQSNAEQIEVNPTLLIELNDKVNKINALFLKHQVGSVEELIEIRNTLSNEQVAFSDLEGKIDDLKKEIEQKEIQLEKRATQLSKNRKKAIPVFIKKIEDLLKNLGLEKAKIEVRLTEESQFNSFGKEHVEILFQANSGFPMKPIQTAISGGERSRVMLAIKKIMAESEALPTLILDEIDTGVSGKIASEMGNVMQDMSKNMQLIVITHLAQVAAKGDSNYKVVKEDVSGKTQSTIIALNHEEKRIEIAQLLSGSTITEAALVQADELMK